MALATGIAPAAWATESDEMVATVIDLLNEEAEKGR